MDSSPTTDPAILPLESILCTEELDRRPTRPPDYKSESRALALLAQSLADSPDTILQTLTDTILEVCKAGSAGISLLSEDEKSFYWPAIAGLWKTHIGGGTPRDFGPCGDVLDRNSSLLFSHVERRYAYFEPVTPAIEEALLVPFYVEGKAVGTIWAIAHDKRRKFDNEDLRMLTSLGAFASATYQAMQKLHLLRGQADGREETSQTLREMNEALLVSSLRQHELTEQAQRTEAALRESEERFRAIADNLPQLAWMADGKGWIGWFNQGWLDYTGTTLEENQGLGWKAVHHPDYVDKVAEKFVRHLREGRDWEDTFPLRGRDGRYRWFLSRMKAIRDKSGQVVRFFGTNTDVTEQRSAAEALTLSENRYRRLFESAKDGILILDARTGKTTDANACMGDLLETDADKLLGKELWEIGLFRDRAANEAALRELREQGYVRHESLPLESELGRQVEVELVANIYSEAQHSVIQCNIRDITERSRLERQTQKQAEALADLHQRKDEFLAMLSHELRNPLSAIFNALHILRLEDTANPIQQKAKSVIERQVGQLAHLIDDLLEVSRVITGGINLQQERLEMRGIVERAIESARPLIDLRKHELSVSLPPEPIWLQGDPTRLEQVVVNLLNNAAKYTDASGQIQLSALQEGGEVVLRVRDTGIGIAPQLLTRIFDLFTQADRTLARSEGGLGIGLSLVKKLVELHGGTVAAFSPGLGQGSEFVVRLPAIAPAIAPMPPAATVKPGPSSRVLVIDDNTDAADMLAMMLQMFGHEVQTAYTGKAALEMMVEYQPDILLLDIGLPDMNGYEVARRVRQGPQGESVTLIAMTGYGQDSDRKLSQEAGFDHHLVKPVEPQKLQDLLASIATQHEV